MTVFLLVAGFMLLIALLFVVPVLVRASARHGQAALSDEVNLAILRDQLQELDRDLSTGMIDTGGYDSAKAELQRRVITDVASGSTRPARSAARVSTAVLVATLLAAITISLYWYLGTPQALMPDSVRPAQTKNTAITPDQVASMVARLEQRLKSSPDDVDGWAMLARSDYFLGRYTDSVRAYAELVKRIPDNADLWADYADALGMSQNRSLRGEPEKFIAKALSINPDNINALALSASAAFEQHDYRAAIVQWQKILGEVQPDSETARSVNSNISEAQNLLASAGSGPGSGPGSVPGPNPAAENPSAQQRGSVDPKAGRLQGQVVLGPNAAGKVDKNDTVFIFVKAVDGPRFPLAVLRRQVKDLPANFQFDDSMGMVPNVRLSDYPTLIVSARISRSGSATRSAGDWEGSSQAVQLGETQIKIIIDRQPE